VGSVKRFLSAIKSAFGVFIGVGYSFILEIPLRTYIMHDIISVLRKMREILTIIFRYSPQLYKAYDSGDVVNLFLIRTIAPLQMLHCHTYMYIISTCIPKLACRQAEVPSRIITIYRVFHKETPPFIFGYNSHINGPICIKFAANIR